MNKIKKLLVTMLVFSFLLVSSSGVWAKNNINIKEINIKEINNIDGIISLLGDPAPKVD